MAPWDERNYIGTRDPGSPRVAVAVPAPRSGEALRSVDHTAPSDGLFRMMPHDSISFSAAVVQRSTDDSR